MQIPSRWGQHAIAPAPSGWSASPTLAAPLTAPSRPLCPSRAAPQAPIIAVALLLLCGSAAAGRALRDVDALGEPSSNALH